jgi:tetratricopeptide (TPR) repeat protein
MDFLTPFTLFFIGLLYIIMLGALSLLRREGLSIRFAVESLLLIGVVGGVAFLTGFVLHPVLFLIILYLVTMRVRLLVDLGNSFAGQGRFVGAERIYNLAEQLGADQASRINIAINRGVARLQQGRVEEAISIFQGVLNTGGTAGLGIKNEAACQYNLGVAYEKQGQLELATNSYKAVMEVWPVSEYARRASIALGRQGSHDH